MSWIGIVVIGLLLHIAKPSLCGFTVGGGGNASKRAGPSNAAKLENETEELSHTRVSSDLKKNIIQARTAKKMPQAQLAQAINEKPQIVNEYESGKAIPNNQVIRTPVCSSRILMPIGIQ